MRRWQPIKDDSQKNQFNSKLSEANQILSESNNLSEANQTFCLNSQINLNFKWKRITLHEYWTMKAKLVVADCQDVFVAVEG